MLNKEMGLQKVGKNNDGMSGIVYYSYMHNTMNMTL